MIPRGFSRRRGLVARGAPPRCLCVLLLLQVIGHARRNRGAHGLQQRQVFRPLQNVVTNPDRLLHRPVSIDRLARSILVHDKWEHLVLVSETPLQGVVVCRGKLGTHVVREFWLARTHCLLCSF